MFENLDDAFEDLREQGLLAEENFMCCSSCGGTEMASRASDLADEGTRIQGCVFYHMQDNDRKVQGQPFYLTFGDLDTTKHGKLGLPTEEVGKTVVTTLTKHGVKTKWDGDANQRIQVLPLI